MEQKHCARRLQCLNPIPLPLNPSVVGDSETLTKNFKWVLESDLLTCEFQRLPPNVMERSSHSHLRRSGYEPSDTENEWQDSPWNERDKPKPNPRSSHKPIVVGGDALPSLKRLNLRKKATTFEVSRHRKHESNRDFDGKQNLTRSTSAPKLRGRERNTTMIHKVNGVTRARNPPVDEINPLSKDPSNDSLLSHSTESILPCDDIFFSRDFTLIHKTSETNHESNVARELLNAVSENDTSVQQLNKGFVAGSNLKSVPSRTKTSSVSAASLNNDSSRWSVSGQKLGQSFKKITAGRQSDGWFSCVSWRTCWKAKSRAISESSFINRAFVVEELRHFWADKHRPSSLSSFFCHKQQALHLKQFISHNCPHILLKGPSGSGKKSLSKALLHDIFGDNSWRISHGLRHFHVQENDVQIVVPLTSSSHHVELNLKSESQYVAYILVALVKDIANTPAPDVSDTSFKTDFRVIVLYDVDMVDESVQHVITWIMDCYTDSCKIILCCEDDSSLLDSIKRRCKLINIDAPDIHETVEVLLQIAKKENFELPVNFASKIAAKSNKNLRRAIMALEACKAHNYPFVDEQPIPIGWEEILVELASDILADPSPKRLFFTRGKFQKLLVEFVHPKLILQKLVEQFLEGIEAGLKKELYYWHAYYDKRLPTGTSALLKLEEFVAKFMDIYRRSSQVPQFCLNQFVPKTAAAAVAN